MNSNEGNEHGRIRPLAEYESDLADALFPPQPNENFFDRELRSQLTELLLEHCAPAVSFTIEALIDLVRKHTPQSLRDWRSTVPSCHRTTLGQ